MILGGIVFVITFGLIVSEVIHRVYATMLGVCSVMMLLSVIQKAPSMGVLMAMIDAGTLLLLMSLMILMHVLSITGFFQYFAVRLLECATDRDGNVSMQWLFF